MSNESPFLPLVEELHPPPDPVEAFRRFVSLPHAIFLDSALDMPELGRYSFLAADPFEFLRVKADGSDALTPLQNKLQSFTVSTVAELPPFQGGAAGLLSYDLNHSLERVPSAKWDEFQTPGLAMGLYDVVLAFDHREGKAWLISQGFPETEPAKRCDRAARRLSQFRELLRSPASEHRPAIVSRLDASSLSPQHKVPGPVGLTSNFSAEDYRYTIRRAIEYIYAGDLFQVNLAQRLLFPAHDDAVNLYLRLREQNPATFAAFFDAGEFQIASASPERFVSLRAGRVETRPIKGTRRRTFSPEADLFTGDELQASEKDRAENVMIVDLLRNDLSRVCDDDSLQVTKLCGLESYRFVQHLVSVVEGRLSPGQTAIDLIRAAFPGGSITGAPKIRAMEVIAELEPNARGPYCGSLGYLGFDGTLDLNILIRTVTAARGWWQLPVGGGITAQSDPQREYEETWHKAEGLLRALR